MQILFTSDRMIIKGRKYQVESDVISEDGKKGNIEVLDCIEIDFTIQVNGKIVNFTESFSIDENTTTEDYSISEWSNWYLIVRILSSMGYSLSNDISPLKDYNIGESNSIIKKWASILMS